VVQRVKLSGRDRASILLMSLGEDVASEVMKHLSQPELQSLGKIMVGLGEVPTLQVEKVVNGFMNQMEEKGLGSIDKDGYMKTALNKALGTEKANEIIKMIKSSKSSCGLENLKWVEPETVASAIQLEHPQIIALILAHLEPAQAAEVLTYFDERTKVDIIRRIATTESFPYHSMQDIEEVITERLQATSVLKSRDVGGIKGAAEVLNQVDSETETAILNGIEEAEPDLVDLIQEQMFVFGDLADVDDRGIRAILREISNDVLVVALKGIDEELQDRFFDNMSERAAEMAREDMEAKGAVKLSEVEEAQQHIINVARRLKQEGKISRGEKGGEALVQ
jgi:flagellar motor switch protein FliG